MVTRSHRTIQRNLQVRLRRERERVCAAFGAPSAEARSAEIPQPEAERGQAKPQGASVAGGGKAPSLDGKQKAEEDEHHVQDQL
jgi:hypothetical protein